MRRIVLAFVIVAMSFADLILAGQAFHCFDPVAFKKECIRVLKPGGYVALVWNEWATELSPFLMDYVAILQEYGTDYNQVIRQNDKIQQNIKLFFEGQKRRGGNLDINNCLLILA